jgi:hypothetical protein
MASSPRSPSEQPEIAASGFCEHLELSGRVPACQARRETAVLFRDQPVIFGST